MAAKKNHFYYKGMRVNAFGIPAPFPKKSYYKRKSNRSIYQMSFASPFSEKSPKNMIVMYDISHDKKKERDWFRRHLKRFGYIMIQKSIWVGPSPLPKSFLEYVKEIGLKNHLKTFKLAKSYSGEDNF